jgi:hypothetical protein
MPVQEEESYFKKYLAILTFGLAAYFAGASSFNYEPTILSICLGYLYAGIITFPVFLLLSRGKEVERCVAGSIVLALTPEIMVVVVIGAVLLVLAVVLFTIAFAFFAVFDATFKTKSLDGFRGIKTKLKTRFSELRMQFSKTYQRKEAARKQAFLDGVTSDIIENKWPKEKPIKLEEL